MPTQTTLPFVFLEETTAEVSWTFEDENAAAIANAALQTATITLYDVVSQTIINSRNDQDILGGSKTGNNNVVIASGVATWYVQALDNAIITSGVEDHVALIKWSWDPGDGNGVRQGKHEIPIAVTDLNMV